MPEARIVLTNTATRAERDLQSGQNGDYRFFPLNPGIYEIVVEKQGFQKLKRSRIRRLSTSGWHLERRTHPVPLEGFSRCHSRQGPTL